MSTMKLDLSEWKNLAISHLRLMANQLDQVGLLPVVDLQKIDAHWGDVIRPRLSAWATESEIVAQEQQRAAAQQPAQQQPLPNPTSAHAAAAPPEIPVKRAGWPVGKKRGPRKPKTDALLNSAAVLPPVTQ